MKRDRVEIISEILNICIKGASKTHIVYQANLNFKTVDPYLMLLIKNNLIEICQGKQVRYKTTERGINLMKNINQLNDTLSEPNMSL